MRSLQKHVGILSIAGALLVLTGCTNDEGSSSPKGPGAKSPALESHPFPPPVLQELRRALSDYEAVRSALARDRLEGVEEPAARAASSLERAEAGGASVPARVRNVLAESARIARSLAEATELAAARRSFGELSRLVLVLANVDPSVLEGWHVYSCPMTKTFPKWMQPSEEHENPYMGAAMPGCGVESDATVSLPPSFAGLEPAPGGDIAYYTCSMHPSVRRNAPGTCPICSMGLVPVTREEVDTGVILVDSERRQAIGVRTATVERRPTAIHVRAVGRIVYDETRLTEVSLKTRGWIGALYADATGERVRKGEPLFTLYSPELYAAEEELLTALQSQEAARKTSVPDRSDYLVEAARTRLRLWDVQDGQVDEIVKKGKPLEQVPILSPVTGYVVEKNVVEGAAVEPGKTLYRIAGLDRIWIEAEVYEAELPLVHVGQKAEITLPYLPGKKLTGRVSFIYPYLEGKSRTGKIRVELPNPSLELKPDMYANVDLSEERGERLVVPVEAVIYAGPRRLVFLDLGGGRLRPQEIQVGLRLGDDYEVLSGLKEGDVVVTSGNFLIGAESRLKSATGDWQ